MNIQFSDPETGKQISAEVEREVTRNGQKWQIASASGIDWAVPTGWPNNAAPICRESEPEAYAEIAG